MCMAAAVMLGVFVLFVFGWCVRWACECVSGGMYRYHILHVVFIYIFSAAQPVLEWWNMRWGDCSTRWGTFIRWLFHDKLSIKLSLSNQHQQWWLPFPFDSGWFDAMCAFYYSIVLSKNEHRPPSQVRCCYNYIVWPTMPLWPVYGDGVEERVAVYRTRDLTH